MSGRKERMTSSPHDPYELGYTRATMTITKSSNNGNWNKSQKIVLFGLQAATRLHEIGITSNRKSEMLR